MATVLMIDASDGRHAKFSALAAAGHNLTHVFSLAEGHDYCSRAYCDLVVIAEEQIAEDRNQLALFLNSDIAPKVVVVTESYDRSLGRVLLEQGVLNYLTHDKAPAALNTLLEQMTETQAGADETHLPSDFSIAGKSTQLCKAFEQARRYAHSEASVLLYGATGTGKELFAKALHKMSPRRAGPLITVDCASLPETLVESLLFGYFRGAFTGATAGKVGLIALANGGTLFLDEVGELPLGIQSKFLRVLQERKFRPVGGGKESRSDFRLIAATNRNLTRMVAEGQFREDLYYRLRILNIELPPLAEREDDILVIAQSLLDKLCEERGVPRKRIAEDLRKSLLAYSWPGNVRELVNVMESVFAVAWDKPLLLTEHLPRFIHAQVLHNSSHYGAPHHATESLAIPVRNVGDRRAAREDRRRSRAAVLHKIASAGPREVQAPREGQAPPYDRRVENSSLLGCFREERGRVLEQFEKEYLAKLHQACRENIMKACSLSQLSRPRLYELYRKHGIRRQLPQ